MDNLFFDIIGYLAIIFNIFSFISKDRNKMLIYGIIATTLFGFSILGYGGYNGLVISVISIIIKLLSLYLLKEKLIYVKIAAFPIGIFLFLLLPEGYEGIIPALSMIFIIIADTQKNILKMKYWYYGSNILWLLYGIILLSPSAILFDIIGFFSITYGIYNIKNKKLSN